MRRTLPDPRPGPLGMWDKLVGPGMTPGETWLVLGFSMVFAGFAGAYLVAVGAPPMLALVGAAIAFDVGGGAVCNMTDTTKRWSHRPDMRPRDHFGFIALHVLHVLLVAALFRGEGIDWAYFAVISTWLLGSAMLVIRSPELLKSPVSAGLLLGAIALCVAGLGPTPGLEWFVPALFLKLLLGHAVPLQRL